MIGQRGHQRNCAAAWGLRIAVPWAHRHLGAQVEARGRCTVRSTERLDIIDRSVASVPRAADEVTESLPPFGKIGNLSESHVVLECATETNKPAVLVVIRGAAQELPVAFLVVTHHQHRESILEDFGRGEGGSTNRTRERPIGEDVWMSLKNWHGIQRLN